ncbi:MAG: hypothetical protein LBV80_06040 [Deltaproteobacteria bacterium]|jgi:hypothetical protein|nr:hypothetical protein [Deltaproteobacteria bacterium]
MTQVNTQNNPVQSNSVFSLADNKTYGAGAGNSLVRTGRGFGGKIVNWFREHFNYSGMRAQNQNALDNLARQLTEQYNGKAGFETLRISSPTAGGGRSITGGELKRQALDIHASIMRNELRALPKDSSGMDVLSCILNTLPSDIPKDMLGAFLNNQILPMLINSTNLMPRLQTLMGSQEMADISQMQHTTQSFIEQHLGIDSRLMAQGKAELGVWADKMNAVALVRETANRFTDMPMQNSSVSLRNVPENTSQLMGQLGIAEFKTLGQASWENSVATDLTQDFLRSNQFGILVRRALASEIAKPHIEAMKAALSPLFENISNLGTETDPATGETRTFEMASTTALRTHLENNNISKEALQSNMTQALQSVPGFKAMVGELMHFVSSELRPLLQGDPDMQQKMMSGFNGVAWLAVCGEMTTEAVRQDSWQMKLIASALQSSVSSSSMDVGQPWRTFFESVDGWNEMIATA